MARYMVYKGRRGGLLHSVLQVRCLVWSPDDTSVISCSMDGAIYEWNVLQCRREKECVLKTCAYSCVALSSDLRSTYAVGSDHTLKEIILADANVSNTS